jgi:hypothetical protein
MKITNLIFALLALVMIQSCVGPEGPEGQPGLDAINIEASVFEVKMDFTTQNNFSQRLNFPSTTLSSDVVMIYIQWEKDGNTPIWRALPQTVFFDEGVLIYNFDFTTKDFTIFLDGPINRSTLNADWRLNQIFRVVVIPGRFASSRIDLTNYEAVTALLELKDEDFQKIDLRKKN